MEQSKRRHRLKQFHYLLNTDEGVQLMKELKSAWATGNPMDNSVQHMGFNIGLGEAYKQMEAWQNGVGLEAEPTDEDLIDGRD